MATTILELLGTVRSDGTLDLDQKVTVAPGRVKVAAKRGGFVVKNGT
jgi:hypothetical protein